MLSEVRAIDDQNRILTISIKPPFGSFYTIDMQGLDPGKDLINTTQRMPRNILMKLGYRPNYASTSIQALRRMLYSFFSPKQAVTLWFYDGVNPYARIGGVVESFDSPLFSASPEAAVSIICKDPDYYDIILETPIGNSVAALTDAFNLILYRGNAAVGFVFKLMVNRPIAGFELRNVKANGIYESLVFAFSLIAGDLVTINTVAGKRSAFVTRAGVVSSIMSGIDPTSFWPTLAPGNNFVYVVVPGAAIPYTIEYLARYRGI